MTRAVSEKIFDAVFECTLSMITKNFEDFPDHCLKFDYLDLSIRHQPLFPRTSRGSPVCSA